ncbi:MAG: hypothetical protein AB1449_12455 [Chloroflexota bacterium]
MDETPDPGEASETARQDRYAWLETMLLEAYLSGKGYTLAGLRELPAEEAKRLMTEASVYASTKLAEVEARAHFVRELHAAGDEASR